MPQMKIEYKPEGGSKRSWTLDMDNPAWDIHKAAPKQVGCGWITFMGRLMDDDGEAWQALIWALRRRTETNLDFDSVDFPRGLLSDVEFSIVKPEPVPEAETAEEGTPEGEA